MAGNGVINFRLVSTARPKKCGVAEYGGNIVKYVKSFTQEVPGSKDITAIDCGGLEYGSDVDYVINQTSRASWIAGSVDASNKAYEMGRGKHHTYMNIHFEHGLGGGPWQDFYPLFLEGVRKSPMYKKGMLHIITTLHTLRLDPNDFQKQGIRNVCRKSDGVIVMAECGKPILEHVYGITKRDTLIEYLDHGVRMYDFSDDNRKEIKRGWGVNPSTKIIMGLGLWSKNKGFFKYGVPGYIKAVKKLEDIGSNLKTRLVLLGEYNPDDPEKEACLKKASSVLNSSGLLLNPNPFDRHMPLEGLGARGIKNKKHGIFVAYGFLKEKPYVQAIGGLDIDYLPYIDKQQFCSGRLSDSLGVGRDMVASKFLYAVEMLSGISAYRNLKELLDPNKMPQEGKIIGIGDPDARGLLVDCDRGVRTKNQLAGSLVHALTNEEEHKMRADNAHEKGHKMEFRNVVWNTVRFFDFIRKKKHRKNGYN